MVERDTGGLRSVGVRIGWAIAGLVLSCVACGDDGDRRTPEAGSTSATGTGAPNGVGTTTGSTTTTGTPGTTVGSSGIESAGTTSGADTTAGSTGEPGRTCDGSFPEAWIDGTSCGDEPSIMVHYYDEDTVILRQSLCTSFEGPFMFMFFGEDRVLLEDTGHGGIPIAETVTGVIDQWLADQGKDSIELVVINSHAHGDHVQGNTALAGVPFATVVGTSVGAVSGFFGIDPWPTDVATYDLGGRAIDVIPIPGHQASHIALFDHSTGLLLTGDTLYPGRLYISDFPTYVQSIERMVAHTEGLEVCHVLGTHVEMTNTPGVDFEFGATMHPDEHPLELSLEHLVELRDAVVAMGSRGSYEVHDDFIIFPLQTSSRPGPGGRTGPRHAHGGAAKHTVP